MRVYNMTSPRTGEPVANQFIIEDDNKVVFQSYNSMIAEIDYTNNILTIGEDWDYSRTTGKYRNAFFDEYMPLLNNAKAIREMKKIYDTAGECYLDRFEVIFK